MSPVEHSSRKNGARLAAAVATVAALLGGAAGPAAAHPREPVSYVALGDSYAAGFGAGRYQNDCGQSPLGLPGILDGKKRIDLIANATCINAKAAGVADTALDVPEQVARLESISPDLLSPDTDLVTISAGGNDAGFVQLAAVCASQPPEACAQAIALSNATTLPTLAGNLDALYERIRDEAPNATVVVTGYPHLFSPEFGNDVSLSLPQLPGAVVPVASQVAFNTGTDALNAVIRDRAGKHGFVFVDVVPAFEGHGLGSPRPWITNQPGAVDNLHPTAKGYRSGYYAAVRDAVDLSGLEH